MNCFDQFHDACGVGVLAHLRGKSSHLLREAAIQGQPRTLRRASLFCSQ